MLNDEWTRGLRYLIAKRPDLSRFAVQETARFLCVDVGAKGDVNAFPIREVCFNKGCLSGRIMAVCVRILVLVLRVCGLHLGSLPVEQKLERFCDACLTVAVRRRHQCQLVVELDRTGRVEAAKSGDGEMF